MPTVFEASDEEKVEFKRTSVMWRIADCSNPEAMIWLSEVASASPDAKSSGWIRSEEHTSELQSLVNIVGRLLLEKKKVGSDELLLVCCSLSDGYRRETLCQTV